MSVTFGPKLGKLINASTAEDYVDAFRAFLRAYDALFLGTIINATTSLPPSTPQNGDAYIVAAGGTNAWVGQVGHIAVWSTETCTPGTDIKVPAWDFYVPNDGWVIWNTAVGQMLRFHSGVWSYSFKLGNPAAIGVSQSTIYDNLLLPGGATLSAGAAGAQLNVQVPTVFSGTPVTFNAGIALRVIADLLATGNINTSGNINSHANINIQGQIQSSGGLGVGQKQVAANYTATNSDFSIWVDASSGAITVTLPDATLNTFPALDGTQLPTLTATTGRLLLVKKLDETANVVTVRGAAGQLLDNQSAYALSLKNAFVLLQSTGNSWMVIGVSTATTTPAASNSLISVTFSAAPTFDATQAQGFKLILTGNVTSSNFINGLQGAPVVFFRFHQDSTGGWTFVWPSNVRNGGLINPTANSRSIQAFVLDLNGDLDALGPMQYTF